MGGNQWSCPFPHKVSWGRSDYLKKSDHDPKMINAIYANMPQSTDINILLQQISKCEIRHTEMSLRLWEFKTFKSNRTILFSGNSV